MKRIYNYFEGIKKGNQKLKLFEELIELIQSILDYINNPNKDTFKLMFAELVDVFILTMQMGLSEGYGKLQLYIMFIKEIIFKLKRTHKIIDECQRTNKEYDEVRY